jgi:hypothetical protein
MKKLLSVCVVATVLAASSAFAFPLTDHQPVKGIEGPDVRLTDDEQSGQPVKQEPEGPDVRLVAFAFQLPDQQPVKSIEGPDVRLSTDHQSAQPSMGTEGPDVR